MAAEPKASVFNISELGQVCFVVRDLDKSMEGLWKTFGIGPWTIKSIDGNMLSDTKYHGKPGKFTFKIARTQKKLGGFEIELIQPGEGDSTYSDFLREHGEGVHHLGWRMVDNMEAFDRDTKALEDAGFPCLTSGKVKGAAFGYFDTTKVLNAMLEVYYRDTSVSPSSPDRIYPEK